MQDEQRRQELRKLKSELDKAHEAMLGFFESDNEQSFLPGQLTGRQLGELERLELAHEKALKEYQELCRNWRQK